MPNTIDTTDVSAASSAQTAAASTAAPEAASTTPSAKKAASRRPSASASASKKAPAPRKKTAAQPAATSAPARDTKAKKPKLVRDSFTIPKDEYAAIEALKLRSGQLGTTAKKSELLRAGLKLLSALDNDALTKALQDVPSIKTGRPKAQESAPASPAAKKAAKPAKPAARK